MAPTARGRPGFAPMEAFAVLIVLPIAIGIVLELVFRDTVHASVGATLATPVLVFTCLNLADPAGGWNWLAALLVSPLAIAFSIATVLFCFGHERRRPRRSGGHA